MASLVIKQVIGASNELFKVTESQKVTLLCGLQQTEVTEILAVEIMGVLLSLIATSTCPERRRERGRERESQCVPVENVQKSKN